MALTTQTKFKPLLSDRQLGWLVVIVFAIMSGCAWLAPKGLNLLLVTICFAAILMAHGLHSNGQYLGAFIGNRNTMSLSKFQLILWTVIVLSAYLTIVFERLRAGLVEVPYPLAVNIDWRLWAMMGISVTSNYFSPLILNNKAAKDTPTDDVIAKTAAKYDLDVDKVKSASSGILYGNPDIRLASFTDIFEGDEMGDTSYVDIAKVQMFFFTVVAIVSYEALVINTIMTLSPKEIVELPVLSEGFLAILGISHAGYLSSKTVTSTKTQ